MEFLEAFEPSVIEIVKEEPSLAEQTIEQSNDLRDEYTINYLDNSDDSDQEKIEMKYFEKLRYEDASKVSSITPTVKRHGDNSYSCSSTKTDFKDSSGNGGAKKTFSETHNDKIHSEIISEASPSILTHNLHSNEKRTIEQRIEKIEDDQSVIKTMLGKVLRNQSEIMTLLKQTTKKNFIENVLFPIITEKELRDREEVIRSNPQPFIRLLSQLLRPEGLVKNLDKILGEDMMIAFNYDGVNKKKSFKEYRALNLAIFESIKVDGYNEREYIAEIRQAFKMHKNKMFKRKYDAKKRIQAKELLKLCNSDTNDVE